MATITAIRREQPPASISLAKAPVTSSTQTHDAIDFERLVGCDGWRRLAPDIRRRFSEAPVPSRPIRFEGIMRTIECSRAGRILAHLCRVIGTPFAPYTGTDVPVSIALVHCAAHAIAWERQYRYPGRRPVNVRSIKRTDAGGGLVECVGFGLGMRLAIFEADRALHFLSLRYFCTVCGRRVWLPPLLTPGTAHVVHSDLGGGRFRFTMSFHHPLLGTLFHQDGIFHREQGDAS
ncbi:MAG: DUF4166 domain-containing protein [Nevskia sp.]|nr:DUF4166 domain-containing protein [Nevskia sp.]